MRWLRLLELAAYVLVSALLVSALTGCAWKFDDGDSSGQKFSGSLLQPGPCEKRKETKAP